MSKRVEVRYVLTTEFPVDRDIRELDKQVAGAIDWQDDEDLATVKIERVSDSESPVLVMNKTTDETIMPVPCMGCGEPIETCVRADRKPYIWHSECFKSRKKGEA